MQKETQYQLCLEPEDNHRLNNLCGPFENHLKQIEKALKIDILRQQNRFVLQGDTEQTQCAEKVLQSLYKDTLPSQGESILITPELVHLKIKEYSSMPDTSIKTQVSNLHKKSSIIKIRKAVIKPRTENQSQYIKHILTQDIAFGVGPAGTGKTYLAVAAAVYALEQQEVQRIILTRPAVEAGEKLGFLPGDLAQKIDPYLRPLYDALFEMLGFERVEKLIERSVIEIAPLAYMRGRTLNDAFVILDESQNTTKEQMKMFLTRIGFNSKAVITGDITQVDLPSHITSGLKHAIEVLSEVDEISFDFFHSKDVVRHPIVAKIVNAYEKWDNEKKAQPE